MTVLVKPKSLGNIAVRDFKMLIDGKWTDAAEGNTLERVAPGHGVTVSRYPAAKKADAERAMDDLDDRGQAIGRARGGGDDAMLRGIEAGMVHAHHDVQRAGGLHWSRHDHALHALVQVGLEHSNSLHLAAGLDHQVAAAPIGVGNGLVGGDANALAVDHHVLAIATRLMLPAAMYRVEVQQVGMGGGITGRVVYLHELQLGPVPGSAQGQAADAAESVDTDFDRHGAVSRKGVVSWSRRTG